MPWRGPRDCGRGRQHPHFRKVQERIPGRCPVPLPGHTQRRHPCRAPGWAMPGPTAEFSVSLPDGETDTAPGISGQGPGLGAGSEAQRGGGRGETGGLRSVGGQREPAESSPRNPTGASLQTPGAHASARAARRLGGCEWDGRRAAGTGLAYVSILPVAADRASNGTFMGLSFLTCPMGLINLEPP